MESSVKREMDAIVARAVHDDEMREILTELGLHEADVGEMRKAMDTLSRSQMSQLLSQSRALEDRSGRSNVAYKELGDYARARWVELMHTPSGMAEEAMRDMTPAMQAAKSQDAERFELYQTRFAEQGLVMRESIAEARNDLRRDIRKAVNTMGFLFDTETRAPLVDHLMRSMPIPREVSEVIGASSRLEAARSQHLLAMEQERHLGLRASPKANLGI